MKCLVQTTLTSCPCPNILTLRFPFQVASENIKTPSMTIPFLPEVTEKMREEARIGLNRVTVADVLETVKVCLNITGSNLNSSAITTF